MRPVTSKFSSNPHAISSLFLLSYLLALRLQQQQQQQQQKLFRAALGLAPRGLPPAAALPSALLDSDWPLFLMNSAIISLMACIIDACFSIIS